MKEKILTYDGKEITVTYDVNRCIHAERCIHGLRDVFDPDKRPWVDPDNASPDDIADVIETCPTGALKYKLKEDARNEVAPSKNRVSIQKDGPVYFYGNVEIQDPQGNTLLDDTRLAMCRCGQSGNKPLCDNTHKKTNFKAHTEADKSKLPEPSTDKQDKLIIKLMKDGPAILEGNYTVESETLSPHTSDKNVALCRCGGSATKPFCDGTHKEIGFKSE